MSFLDVSQYVTILKKEVSAIAKNVATQLMDTKVVMLMKEKVNELKSLYPTEFSLLEDVYTKLIVPSSTEVLAMVNKMVAVPAFGKYLYISMYVLYIVAYKCLIFMDSVYKSNNLTKFCISLDYQKYWTIVITDMPELFNKLSQRILSTQIVNKLRAAYPTLFIITENIYSNVILPTMNDIVAFIKKVTSLPVGRFFSSKGLNNNFS